MMKVVYSSSLQSILFYILSNLPITVCGGRGSVGPSAESARDGEPSAGITFDQWIVSVGWNDDGRHKHLCPGAIGHIFNGSSNVVITTAICLTWFPEGAQRQIMLDNTKTVLIATAEPHEAYKRSSAENNIALLKLSEIIFGQGTELSDQAISQPPGSQRHVADWFSKTGGPPYKLIEYPMVITRPDECKTPRYPFKARYMMCVMCEENEMRNHCVSLDIPYGAPLYIKGMRYRDDVLIGIYSQHLSPENRDIYIRVSPYWGWIKDTIWKMLAEDEMLQLRQKWIM